MLARNHLPNPSPGNRAPRSTDDRGRWIFAGFIAFALILLAVEHRAQVLGWLPWLILLACPAMHVFMHGSHGGHGNHGRNSGGREEE